MRCNSARHSAWLVLVLLWCVALEAQTSQHDRAFWRGIAKNHYAVPENESAAALAGELSGMLGSPDPEMRDDLAYSILAAWTARANILPPQTLVTLADEWRANLKRGVGETGTDSVLRRSFSALCLSMLAERELKAPFLGDERYHQTVADAVVYLKSERDLRGYDAKLGWIHSTAHTADLLQALAGSPLLTAVEQATIMSALAERLSSAPQVYSQGEQDRVAAAVLAVIRRTDFEAAGFDSWLARLQDEDRKVWASPLTPETLARYQNHTYMLQGLAVRLALEPESPRVAGFKQQVLGILRKR